MEALTLKTKTLVNYLGTDPLLYVFRHSHIEALAKTKTGFAVYTTHTKGETWFFDKTYKKISELPIHLQHTQAEN